jgi:predicted nucleotidyltransferase
MNYPLYNNTLCSDVWNKIDDDYQLKPDVRKSLLTIANDFIKKNAAENGIKLIIKDVVLVGSIVNFNWTPYSDFDLHVIVDFAELDMSPEDAKVLVDGLKSAWNKQHAITIKGHPVELYIQDINENPSSAAVYSVKNDKWIKEPVKKKPTFDKEFIKRKHAQIKSKLDAMLANPSEESLESMLERIYDMRQAGLDKKGEFSEENIVFKILRSQGYLDRIKDAARKVYDTERSLDEIEKIDDGIGLNNNGLTDVDDDVDDLIPVDDDSSKRVHQFRINGVPIKVFGAYKTKSSKSKEVGNDWNDDSMTFTK